MENGTESQTKMTIGFTNLVAICHKAVCFVAAMLMLVSVSTAQEQAALEALPDSTRPFVVSQDPLMQFNIEPRDNERVDLRHGVVRAAYQLQPDTAALDSPELTARAWLKRHGARFGITQVEALELTRHVEAQGIHHLTFQQTHQGIPVYGRTVQVNMGLSGLPSMVLSSYAPHMESTVSITALPMVNASEAKEIAARAVSSGSVQTGEAKLHFYPSESPQRAWQVMVWPDHVSAAWEVLLDADSGELIFLINRVRYRPTKG